MLPQHESWRTFIFKMVRLYVIPKQALQFRSEHLNQAQTSRPGHIYLPQGQAFGFSHGWFKIFGTPRYPHHKWMGNSGRVQWKMRC